MHWQRDNERARASRTPLDWSTTHLATNTQPDHISNDDQNKIARRTHADAPSELTERCSHPSSSQDHGHEDPAVIALWNFRHANTAPIFTLYHAPDLHLAAVLSDVAPAPAPAPASASPPSTRASSPATPASSIITSPQDSQSCPTKSCTQQQPHAPFRSTATHSHAHRVKGPIQHPHMASTKQSLPSLHDSMVDEVHKLESQLSRSQAQNEALVHANRQLLLQLSEANKALSRDGQHVDHLCKKMRSMKGHLTKTEKKVARAQEETRRAQAEAAQAKEDSRNAQEMASRAERNLNDVVELAALEVLKNEDYVKQIEDLSTSSEVCKERILYLEREAQG